METISNSKAENDVTEWAESEWFQTWLQLARGEESEHNPADRSTE